MKHTLNFTELGKDDAPIAGGKGASLGEMTQAGIPVPGGFVVLADTFDAFLHETDLVQEIDAILDGVNHEAIHTVERASEDIQALILSRPMPEVMQLEIQEKFHTLGSQYVAVRSSATAEDGAEHAWAGQLDSYLNTTEKDLIEKVCRCWASLFTPRAIFYRFEKGLHSTKISVAVVVQKMVNSEISGIAFSVHPVTEDYNQLIIEAGFGLGEAIVSGSVTPDSYVVEKSPRNILDVNVSHQGRAMYRKEVAEDEQSRIRGGSEWRDLAESRATSQVLNEEQINELSDIILRIESHYGFPCDIEWAYAGDEVGSAEDTRSDKGQFYIVQSRPITTLTIKVGADNGVVRLLDQGNKEVLPLTKENTVFTFESTGTTFLFEDIVSHHYIQWECIRVAKGDNVRVFVEKNEVKRMHIEGAAMTRSFLEEKVSLMQEQSQYMESHILELKMKGALTQNDLQEFFRPLEVICDGYSFFDIHYSDGMVKGDDFSEAGEYVQSVKNVLRDVLGIPFFTEDGWFKTGLGVLAKQFDLPIETLEWYTKADIEKLFDGERVSGQIIDGGKLASVLYKNKTGLMTWVIGNEALTIFETFQDNNVGVHEVRGTVAHKGTGTIQGIVRVVKKDFSDPSHLLRVAESINQGEILVTDTTDPDFLPIMKKSGAIVTDVGGMLSHASITSRELNKLCVVGTVNASKVFKDGDLVEVDADNGVVRILEKHEEIHVTFTLSYTRDTTLFMQELWAKSLINLPKEKFGWQNPYLPLVAHYENDGVVEIWQNMEALGWFMDKLFEENKKGTEFADALFAEYQRLLERFQDLVEKGLLNKENVNEFKEIASQSVFIITVFIYIGTDERTPENVQKICVKAREMYDLFAESDSYIRKSIEEYAGYNSEIAGVVLAKEFSNIPKKELLQKRLKNFLLIDGEEMYTETLHDFEKDGVNYKFPQENSNHEGELQGQVAFRGHVKGTVKIVRKQGDLEKVEVGDILVSPMTTPDFLPAMKKTAAFVTDEGGITCHAAIVAREMGKPCIIGTKIATEVLKDGDLVEVDAESGIVRIIERD